MASVHCQPDSLLLPVAGASEHAREGVSWLSKPGREELPTLSGPWTVEMEQGSWVADAVINLCFQVVDTVGGPSSSSYCLDFHDFPSRDDLYCEL